MARTKAIYRKLQKQRRYAVDEVRLRDMNSAAHRRASIVSGNPMDELFKDDEQRDKTHFKAVDLFKRQVKDLMGVMPDELPSRLNKRRRLLLGLEGDKLEGNDLDLQTPRDLVMHRLKIMLENMHCIFRSGDKALYLIRSQTGLWYFVFKVQNSYYKKSVQYSTRTKAMERYETEKISWIEFFED